MSDNITIQSRDLLSADIRLRLYSTIISIPSTLHQSINNPFASSTRFKTLAWVPSTHSPTAMPDSPAPAAGAGAAASRAEATLLPQAVMEYLQQHGFDKALQALQTELQTRGGDEKDADGEEEGEEARASGAAGATREAVFRAPPPIPLDNMVKRNIPQATTVSVSTMSDKITPEFIAQSKYIIEQLTARLETQNADEEAGKPGASQTAFIDPSDRVEGYKKYRRWVSDGLDIWKVSLHVRQALMEQFELDNISFPLFAHTFLDLIDFGFTDAAQQFYKENHEHHKIYHPTELSYLSAISAPHQVLLDPYAKRLRSERYQVPMSRNSFALMVQWLSGSGLDEEWEAGLHSAPGRAKEAVRAIVHQRLDVKGESNRIIGEPNGSERLCDASG